MRDVLAIALLSVAVMACYGSRKPELEAFAAEYVESVYLQTELYRRYTPELNREVVELSRANMTGDFELVGWDYAGSGIYEYGFEFSNGAAGIVTVREVEGEIASAGLLVPPPSASGDVVE